MSDIEYVVRSKATGHVQFIGGRDFFPTRGDAEHAAEYGFGENWPQDYEIGTRPVPKA